MVFRKILGIFFFVLWLAFPAAAAENPDPSRPVSLEIVLRWEETPVAGEEIQLYLIGTMDAAGNLTLLAEYEAFSVLTEYPKADAAVLRETAEQIEAYIGATPSLRTADTAYTDETGTARFPSDGTQLHHGLYLVSGTRVQSEGSTYSTSAFFVMLPALTENGWRYHVQARAKVEKNEDRICIRVIKEWDDRHWEHKRPKQIQVTLLCDEQPYDTVTLPHNGKWTYQWGGLDGNHNWWVAESPVPGYDSEVYRNGNTFLIRNTYVPVGPVLPQTGQLRWPVPVLAAAGTLMILHGRKQKRRRKHET